MQAQVDESRENINVDVDNAKDFAEQEISDWKTDINNKIEDAKNMYLDFILSLTLCPLLLPFALSHFTNYMLPTF